MIPAIADRHGLVVVEDACQAHGATFRGRRAGSFGHGAFSLYAHEEHDDGRGRLHHDRRRPAGRLAPALPQPGHARARYQFEMLGYNFRMTDIAAAIGLVQLDKLERNTARRQAIAARYDAAFARAADRAADHPGRPDPRLPPVHARRRAARATRSSRTSRAAGVGADIYYPIPVHRQAYIMERGLHADLPVTDARRGADARPADVPGPDRRRAGPGRSRRSRAAVERHVARRRGRAVAAGRGQPPPDDRRLAPAGARERGRPRGPRVDGPEPPADPARPATTCGSSRSPIPVAEALDAAAAPDRRPGLRRAAGDDRRGGARRAS